MKKTMTAFALTGCLVGLLATGGCTQMPTEKQSISDMRPQIAFKVGDDQSLNGRVLLDSLDVGTVGDYLEGSAALRILSGNHVLRVLLGNQTVLEEKFYVGEGANRTFIVK
ncbi:MAG: hypothetical protein H6R10_2198 [Rhodocyclaceae bacterium]|nr:hypothetical protein [Rhodocyclaceae bacterium]